VAQALIVDEPPQPAAAIVVLGGGSGDREAAGARLFADGFAPMMVTTGGHIALPGLPNTTWAGLSADELARRGVPESSIIQISDSTSTCEDAQMAIAALPTDTHRVIIVTDPFHTRRAQWMFEQAAPGVEIITVAARPSWFDPARWWTDERGWIVVFQEYIKFAAILLKGCRQ
jgi:uncharacterized SAM-binding protein YcdF (DUF218 family)